MEISVKITFQWKNITLKINTSDTIYQIKEKIQEKEGIEPWRLILVFKWMILSDFQTVSEWNRVFCKDKWKYYFIKKIHYISEYVKNMNLKWQSIVSVDNA